MDSLFQKVEGFLSKTAEYSLNFNKNFILKESGKNNLVKLIFLLFILLILFIYFIN